MSVSFGSAGAWMLVLLVVSTVYSGLAVWLLLLGIASVFACVGMASGIFTVDILAAVTARVLGLLENDLLQALPLYVGVGFLMDRLKIAQAIFGVVSVLLGRLGAASACAALLLGALIAPMIGSVASSATVLGRVLGPQLHKMRSARAAALISLASTIGVVVPPSLVLLLLGDALMRAHTEAMQIPGLAQETLRTINTQDVFHAALLPSLALVSAWLVATWWQGRNTPAVPFKISVGQTWTGWVSIVFIGLLFGGVFMGLLRAVEAAASAAIAMAFFGLLSKKMSHADWSIVLRETLELSGALMALLVGASVFSLVFRLFGTDIWITQALANSYFSATVTAALVLLGVGFCALALDALEMIFVIIPIVAPPLIGLLRDAQQVAVLLLLVLQASFLIPPVGYAVIVARVSVSPAPHTASMWRALAPFMVIQALALILVFRFPYLVHGLDATKTSEAPPPSLTIEDQLRAIGHSRSVRGSAD